MVKNLLMGGKKPMATPPSLKAEAMTKGGPLAGPPFVQREGKMKAAGLGKKAKKVAEEIPTGPMKGLR
jgi:hypothetical protein